jgi:hypothetical protein
MCIWSHMSYIHIYIDTQTFIIKDMSLVNEKQNLLYVYTFIYKLYVDTHNSVNFKRLSQCFTREHEKTVLNNRLIIQKKIP